MPGSLRAGTGRAVRRESNLFAAAYITIYAANQVWNRTNAQQVPAVEGQPSLPDVDRKRSSNGKAAEEQRDAYISGLSGLG